MRVEGVFFEDAGRDGKLKGVNKEEIMRKNLWSQKKGWKCCREKN